MPAHRHKRKGRPGEAPFLVPNLVPPSRPAEISDLEIFVAKLDELDRRATLARGEHDTLEMAAILRLLLIDRARLLQRANANYRMRILFTVTEIEPDAPYWDPGEFLHFRPGTILTSTELPLDQFLKRAAIVLEGQPTSVRELIRFFAHNEGGVHFNAVLHEDAKRLRLWRPSGRVIRRDGTSVTSMATILAGIARVVVDALQPLRARAWEDLPPDAQTRILALSSPAN